MAQKKFKGIAADFINNIKAQFIGQGADPNRIIVQDLYNYQSKDNTNSMFKTKSNSLDIMSAMSPENREILQSLLSIYNQHIETKREILTQARNLFNTDIVQTVIDVMIDDGFNAFQNENEEFIIEYVLDDEELDELGE